MIWPPTTLPSVIDRLDWLDNAINDCASEGIDSTVLERQRAKMLWELEQGDHS